MKNRQTIFLNLSISLQEEATTLLARLDDLNDVQMDEIIAKFKMTSPTTGNAVTECVAFNLMFSTSIGPTGKIRISFAYCRPLEMRSLNASLSISCSLRLEGRQVR